MRSPIVAGMAARRVADGEGMQQDKHQAKVFFRMACDLGLQLGCEQYRILNEQGY